jgi:hypothetical protein
MTQQYADAFELNVDLTNTPAFTGEGGAPTVPAGEYVVDIIAFDEATSSTNNPMIEVKFAVAEGPHTGAELRGWYSLQTQALGRIAMLGKAVGARMDKIRKEDYMGGRFRATVVHNPGKQQFDPEGKPFPLKVFANVLNERPLKDIAVEAPAQPPVTRGAKPANGQGARRA